MPCFYGSPMDGSKHVLICMTCQCWGMAANARHPLAVPLLHAQSHEELLAPLDGDSCSASATPRLEARSRDGDVVLWKM